MFQGATTFSHNAVIYRFPLVVFIALLAGNCGEPMNPVGAISLALGRSSVPLGGPVDLMFRFDAAPGFTGFDEDYRVMVHFLDDKEELMFGADHDPPIPTSAWKFGQSVSYTHRAVVPMYPYIGDVMVAVGLYSVTTGERLLLEGDEIGDRSYQGALLSLVPQAESSFLLYEEGWYQEEFDRDANVQWRWTSENASLSFRNPGSDATLYLELDGRPDLVQSQQEVTVVIGDAVVGHVTVESPQMEFVEIELPREALGDGETVEVHLRVVPTFVPLELDRGPDERELGIRVFYAFVEAQ